MAAVANHSPHECSSHAKCCHCQDEFVRFARAGVIEACAEFAADEPTSRVFIVDSGFDNNRCYMQQ